MAQDSLRFLVLLVGVGLDPLRFPWQTGEQPGVKGLKHSRAVIRTQDLYLLHHEQGSTRIDVILEISDQFVTIVHQHDLAGLFVQRRGHVGMPLGVVLLAGTACGGDDAHVGVQNVENGGQKCLLAGFIRVDEANIHVNSFQGRAWETYFTVSSS